MQKALKALVFVGILTVAAPSFAQVYFSFGIRLGPPPPRREVIVACPHSGWVWIPGYWSWGPRIDRYYWVGGYWTPPPRPDVVWIAPRWEETHGRWFLSRGRWADRDRWEDRDHRRGHWEDRGHRGDRGHWEDGGHRGDGDNWEHRR